MPDDKPIPSEEEKPSSILSRFSAVVLFITTLASFWGGGRWALGARNDGFYENLFYLGGAGWIVFLTAIYISGRYKDALVECSKVSEKVLGEGIEEGVLFWFFPLIAGFFVGGFFWVGDLVIDGVVWLIRLIGGFIRS